MGKEFGPATPIRRFLAVWTDLSVFLVLWLGAGIYLPADWAPYAAPAFLVVNTSLTAFTGFSLGRALTGIRVVKAPSGGAIGLPRALLRALIVFATGWMLVFAFIAEYRLGFPAASDVVGPCCGESTRDGSQIQHVLELVHE